MGVKSWGLSPIQNIWQLKGRPRPTASNPQPRDQTQPSDPGCQPGDQSQHGDQSQCGGGGAACWAWACTDQLHAQLQVS